MQPGTATARAAPISRTVRVQAAPRQTVVAPSERTLSVTPIKTLTLKPRAEQGVVRTSFSHGRSKTVVVEKVKRRLDNEAPQRAEADQLRQQREEAERRAREEAERRAREEAERKALEKEERRHREEAARKQQEEKKRKQQEQNLGKEQSRADREKLKQREAKVRLPPIEIIPKQSKRAIAFTSVEHGPLAVLPDKGTGLVDPEQAQLYSRLRGQLQSVLDETPSQEIGQLTQPIGDFLSHPENWQDVKHKKLLWLSGNALRNILAKHDSVARDPDPHYAKLPSVLSEALRRPVETWNVVVLGDPTLRSLDRERLGPQEVKEAVDQIGAAQPILVAAAQDRRITTVQASAAIEASLAAASESGNNIHTQQAKKLARGTSKNVIVQILRGAHRTAQDLQNPTSDAAVEFVKEYKSGIYKKLGEWTVTGAALGAGGAAMLTYYYGLPFFEFVIAQGPVLKAYLADTFQNPQLMQIIDAIDRVRGKILEKEFES